MFTRMVSMAVVLAASVVVSGSAVAQEQEQKRCGPLEEIARQLDKVYGERPVARLIANEGKLLLVIFARPDGSTWSEVGIQAGNPLACAMASGTGWQLGVFAGAPAQPGVGL